MLGTVKAALLPGAAGRMVPPPNRLVSCRDAFCARRSSCTRLTASAVAAYKIRLTRASRGWRLRGPRPRWSRGPRASYSAASGRLKDLTRLFCLIARRARRSRITRGPQLLLGPMRFRPVLFGQTRNERRMHRHTHLLDGVHGAGCAGRRGTCDVTSVRSRPSRLGCTTEVARELQFHVNNLAPLVASFRRPRS